MERYFSLCIKSKEVNTELSLLYEDNISTASLDEEPKIMTPSARLYLRLWNPLKKRSTLLFFAVSLMDQTKGDSFLLNSGLSPFILSPGSTVCLSFQAEQSHINNLNSLLFYLCASPLRSFHLPILFTHLLFLFPLSHLQTLSP